MVELKAHEKAFLTAQHLSRHVDSIPLYWFLWHYIGFLSNMAYMTENGSKKVSFAEGV